MSATTEPAERSRRGACCCVWYVHTLPTPIFNSLFGWPIVFPKQILLSSGRCRSRDDVMAHLLVEYVHGYVAVFNGEDFDCTTSQATIDVIYMALWEPVMM